MLIKRNTTCWPLVMKIYFFQMAYSYYLWFSQVVEVHGKMSILRDFPGYVLYLLWYFYCSSYFRCTLGIVNRWQKWPWSWSVVCARCWCCCVVFYVWLGEDLWQYCFLRRYWSRQRFWVWWRGLFDNFGFAGEDRWVVKYNIWKTIVISVKITQYLNQIYHHWYICSCYIYFINSTSLYLALFSEVLWLNVGLSCKGKSLVN